MLWFWKIPAIRLNVSVFAPFVKACQTPLSVPSVLTIVL